MVAGRRAAVDLTNAEKKLTEKEAGEDRVPGTLTIQRTTASQATHAQAVLDLLTGHDEPLTGIEVCVALGVPLKQRVKESPVVATAVKSAIDSLIKTKQVFGRLETSDERRLRLGMTPEQWPAGRVAWLYSTKRRVPLRVTRDLVGFVVDGVVLPRDASKIVGARKREARNQRVLEMLITLGRVTFAPELTKLSGISSTSINDALRDLKSEGVAHCGAHFVRERGRPWATVDVPLTTSPSPKEKKTVTLPAGMSPTEHEIIKAAERLPEFTFDRLSEETGRHQSTVSEAVRRHPELFEKLRTENRRGVYRSKVAEVASAPPVVFRGTEEMVGGLRFLDNDAAVLEQIKKLVGGSGDAVRIAELQAENARLVEQLRKAKAALAAVIGE